MQIKDFFLDLREWPQYAKKQNNLWLLESEAFKEPLHFTFEFDSQDKKELEQTKEECKRWFTLIQEREKERNKILEWLQRKEQEITKGYQRYQELDEKYDNLLRKIKEREEKVNKKISEDNHQIENIHHELKAIRKEISLPQPQKVYTNTWDEFVAWTDVYYGYPFLLPHWDYIILEQYEYEPQNEYVMNQDEIKIMETYIRWKYIPNIQLEASNMIDKPVSKVRLTVLFFQI